MTREEAIKILKAIRVYECYPKSASEETKEAVDMAIDALSAEAVEVVRCGRCEWWKCNPNNMNTSKYGVCEKVSYDDFEVVMESDDFCSYGKRREDGEA